LELFNENTTDFQSGVLIPVNKPIGWTSFDVVNKIRGMLKYHREYKKIKVGHAGTLDPAAEGLLLVCAGRATKQIDTFQSQNKTYEATFHLGETTPSFDRETDVDNTFPIDHITKDLVDLKLLDFIGEIDQMPPAYSALKINGKHAYDLVRNGITPELKSRKITIEKIDLTRFELPEIDLTIYCHKGTYIRSLARDVGHALDSGAWMSFLKRTQIGDYHLNDAWSIEEIEKILIK
jgi:tRNA pseudouridine55 synthase